ncbi:MAG: primase-helicase zinc-binding domain-containing protein [Thermodesulfobacteriota bacterium]
MSLIDLLAADGFMVRRVATTRGGEYAGPCPFCQGTDRFRVWPEHKGGCWWCRQCGRSGDLIQYLRDVRGVGFKEACQYVGKDIETPTTIPSDRKPRPAWQPRETAQPNGLWQARAKRLVEESERWLWSPLAQAHKMVTWLKDHRGLSEETIRAHRLGFIPADLWEEHEQWGVATVPRENGGPKKIWIPRGMTIPLCHDDQVLRIRIRRPRLAGEPRYYLIRGSDTRALVLSHDREIYIVVESELDAMLLYQEASERVGIVALGNAQTRPDREPALILRNSKLILLALDTDEAGAKEAWLWWGQTFTQAVRWPPVEGKDPGEMWAAGVVLKDWITAGIEFAEWR